MLAPLSQDLVDHLQVLHLLPLGLGHTLHVTSVVNFPLCSLIALRFLLEALELDFSCFLCQVEGLGAVLDERIARHFLVDELFVGLVPFLCDCEFFGFTANHNAWNKENS